MSWVTRSNRRMRRYAANPEMYNRRFFEAIDKSYRKSKGTLGDWFVFNPTSPLNTRGVWTKVRFTSGLIHKGGKP